MQRFWNRVQKGEGCWPWLGARTKNGYGQIRVDGRCEYTHRLSWRLASGKAPDGVQVLHTCDNPPCVRPDHLFLGTQAANVADMDKKGRRRSAAGDDSGARTHPERRPRGERSVRAKLTEDQVGELRRLYEAGASSCELAGRFGISHQHAWVIASGKNWAHRDDRATRAGRRTGDLHHRSKLDADRVREIRALAAAGETQRNIAAAFDVPQSAIWSVIHRKTWKHVE